ncbi:hypothetical protein [Nonomuraea sp. NPDC049607]|uniref:hypothetical protein n=1 Tax=Nonomuraea sp. NPDC049607 TaxID=3154732 RepID=UPI003440924B
MGRLIGRWDPVVLGVHRAIGGGLLPPYVRRDHDELLDALLDPAVAANRLVVLRGSSSTGKSRAAYEAVAARLPHWPMLYPRSAAALGRLLQQGIANRTVLWLNELRHYVDAPDGGMPLFDLAELLDGRNHVVAVTTLWPHHWSAYNAADHDRAALASVRAAHALLRALPDLTRVDPRHLNPDCGGVIDIPDAFTDEQLDRARCHGGFMLDQALTAAQDAGTTGRLTQYLAGVPDLLAHYQSPGADPYGRALILAAMDAVRLGHNPLLSRDLLQQAAIGYLAPQHRVRLAAEDAWTGGWEYATRVLKGAIQALQPIPPELGIGIAGYRLADYLDQHGRRIRSDLLPPAAFWKALLRYAAPPDLMLLANAALDRGLTRHAAQLVKRAAAITTPNDTYCAYSLAKELQRWGATDQAAALARRAATHGSLDLPHDVVELIMTLRELGAIDGVTALVARSPASHVRLDDPLSVARLVRILQESGATDQALILAKRAATHVLHLGWPGHVGLFLRVLRDLGATDQFTLLAKNAAAHACLDDPLGVSLLLRSLQEFGATDQALALAKRAATCVGLGSPIHVVTLMEELLDMGATDQVVALAQHAATSVPLGDTFAVATLLRALRKLSAIDQALTLAKRAATPIVLDHQYGVPVLLETMREAGATDQVIALATDAHLDSPNGVAALLEALQKAEAIDHVTALIARNPAAHARLGDVWGITALLRALREVGATHQVTALAQRAATRASLDHLHSVASLLKELRKLGMTEHANVLAQRAATHAPLDRLRETAILLRELRKLGMTEHANVLAQRAATHASLVDPRETAVLLKELQESSDTNQAFTLAHRAATDICLEDSTRVKELLEALRELGMTDQVRIIIDRLPPAGQFFLFLKQQETNKTRFRFGRSPDGSPAAQWSWDELE